MYRGNMSKFLAANGVLKQLHAEEIVMEPSEVSEAYDFMRKFVKKLMIQTFCEEDPLFNYLYKVRIQ